VHSARSTTSLARHERRDVLPHTPLWHLACTNANARIDEIVAPWTNGPVVLVRRRIEMKTALIAIAALVAALVLPAVASAQDWVMDWHSTGNVAGPPFTWDITGTSPASLTPVPGGLPPTFTSQAFNLSFTNLGRTFGGLVAQGSFQDSSFAVPATAPINSFSSSASGTFNQTGTHFTLDAFVGPGNNRAEITATGTQNVGVTPTPPVTPVTPVTPTPPITPVTPTPPIIPVIPVTPVTPTTPSTPTASAAEPGILLLGGAGLIGAAAMRRRQRL
jgi:hypothetical protein